MNNFAKKLYFELVKTRQPSDQSALVSACRPTLPKYYGLYIKINILDYYYITNSANTPSLLITHTKPILLFARAINRLMLTYNYIPELYI